MPHSKDSVLTLAYLAGIIDGEGHVGIKRAKAYKCQGRTTPGYHARIAVRMTDRPAISLLHNVFGGSFRKERGQAPNRRPLWSWSVTDKAAETTIRLIARFLLVKRKQASIVLVLRRLQRNGHAHRTKITGYRNFPNSYGTARIVPNLSFSDEYIDRCHSLYHACRCLNGLAAKMQTA